MRLKCTNGVYDGSGTARGASGLFESVYSDEITLLITDPCETSIVNDDAGISAITLQVTFGKTSEVMTFDGPTDSVSNLFGNGYDRCGDLKYEITAGTSNYTDAFMDFTPTVNTDAKDDLTFKVVSFATGDYVSYEMVLTVSLVDYPTATPAMLPLFLNYRECAPFGFDYDASLKGAYFEYYAREESYPEIDLTIAQSPCSYAEVFEAGYEDDFSQLPSFATLTDDGFLQFSKVQNKHAGEYKIVLRTSLIKISGRPAVYATTTITLAIIPKEDPVILPPKDPKFYLRN